MHCEIYYLTTYCVIQRFFLFVFVQNVLHARKSRQQMRQDGGRARQLFIMHALTDFFLQETSLIFILSGSIATPSQEM